MTRTLLAAADLEALAASFGLGALRASAHLEAGTINSNYRLECAAGDFFLRVNEGKSDADVEYEIALIDAISAAGVSTPVPLTDRDEQRFVRHAGKQVCVFPWLAGEHREGARLRPPDLRSLGGALAGLHAATSRLQSLRRPSIYSTREIATRCKSIECGDDAELRSAVALARTELEALEQLSERRGHGSETIVIHGDLFPDNVLFEGDSVAALLDFEQAAEGSPVYELAVCLNAWCHRDDKLEGGLASALLKGYLSERELPGFSGEALWIECRAAAVRFLVTRITDVHLAGLTRTGKSYIEYRDRLLGWHRVGQTVLEALL